MKKTTFLTLTSLIFSLLLAVPALAEHKVVERVTITVSPQQTPRNSGTVTTWIGQDRVVRIDELNRVTTIIRRDTQPQQMFIVLHEEEVVLELELPVELPEHLVPAFAELKMNWNLNRLPQERTIGKWDCQRFIITGTGPLSVTTEIWATVDTTIDTRRFHAMLGESLKVTPIFADMADTFYSISPNFAIETVTTVEQLGLRTVTTSRVQSITEEAAPESIYQIPEDYTRKPLDFAAYLSLIRTNKPNTEY
jgi:hypothetical protein